MGTWGLGIVGVEGIGTISKPKQVIPDSIRNLSDASNALFGQILIPTIVGRHQGF